jgi:DnaJ-domain-containing protein 1
MVLEHVRQCPDRRDALVDVELAIGSGSRTILENMDELLRLTEAEFGSVLSQEAAIHRAALGVDETCSRSQLKAAYRQKVLQWHPDRLDGMAPEFCGVATQRMVEINEAYRILSTT